MKKVKNNFDVGNFKVNCQTEKNNSPTAISSIYREDKTKLKKDVEIANSLNHFFCTIGKKVGENVEQPTLF